MLFYGTVPSSSAYPGRGGSSLSREAQTALSPATSTSSSGGIPRRSQASRERYNPSSVSWVGPEVFILSQNKFHRNERVPAANAVSSPMVGTTDAGNLILSQVWMFLLDLFRWEKGVHFPMSLCQLF